MDFVRRSFASKSIKVEVSTVDGFQGREKEVIILSLVRSNQDRELGFVTDFKRLNVAVTRARRLLIIIADSETMEKDELITSLLKHIEENGLLQTAEEYLSETIDKEIEKIEKTSQSKVKPKIRSKAKAKIIKREKTEEAQVPLAMEQKAYETIIKKSSVKLSRKGTELNADMNIKKFNVFQTIATAQSDEGENFFSFSFNLIMTNYHVLHHFLI